MCFSAFLLYDMWIMKWRSDWHVFLGPVILPCILKTIWCMNIIIWDYESVWPDVWPKNKCKSLYFMVVILCYILKTFYVWTSQLGIMGQYYQTFDLKINACHCDLYFMVQWFCIISQSLFGGRVSCALFQITKQGDQNFDLKINIGQHDLYFMV